MLHEIKKSNYIEKKFLSLFSQKLSLLKIIEKTLIQDFRFGFIDVNGKEIVPVK